MARLQEVIFGIVYPVYLGLVDCMDVEILGKALDLVPLADYPFLADTAVGWGRLGCRTVLVGYDSHRGGYDLHRRHEQNRSVVLARSALHNSLYWARIDCLLSDFDLASTQVAQVLFEPSFGVEVSKKHHHRLAYGMLNMVVGTVG